MSSERLNKTAVKDARLKDLLLERGTGASAGAGTAGCGPGTAQPGPPRALAGGAAGRFPPACGVCVRGELRGNGLVSLLIGL